VIRQGSDWLNAESGTGAAADDREYNPGSAAVLQQDILKKKETHMSLLGKILQNCHLLHPNR
jgi:hypothetical protein